MLKIAVAAAFCFASASAQLTPEQQALLDELLLKSENAELAALLAANGDGGIAAIESKNLQIDELIDLQKQLPIKLSTDAWGVNTHLKPGMDVSFTRLQRQTADFADVQKNLEDLEKLFDDQLSENVVADNIAAAVKSSLAADRTLASLVTESADLKASLEAALVDSQKAVEDDLAAFTTWAEDHLKEITKAVEAEAEARKADEAELDKDLVAFTEDTKKKLVVVDGVGDTVSKQIDDALKPIQSSFSILDRVQLTYMKSPKNPVFRWTWWQTYDQSFSWFDGNDPRAFGGVHPSQWTDNGYRSWDMNADLKYIKRFFVRHGTAHKYGATICSECYFMYSSTTGRMCGVAFRIKNTGSSATNWNPEFMYTSWSGWGEDASASLNGASTWRHWCGGSYCRTNIGFKIQANPSKDRISTIIFVTGGTNTYHVGYNRWERANILMFNDNSLSLPNNLEYVDDLDTATGSWKN